MVRLPADGALGRKLGGLVLFALAHENRWDSLSSIGPIESPDSTLSQSIKQINVKL